MKESSTVGHEKMKKLLEFYCRAVEFYCRLLEFYCRAMEFYCPIFLKIFTAGVLMSLEFYCRWGSTFGSIFIFLNIEKIGVLLSLEFFCLWSSTVFVVLRSPYPIVV
jgi:hypothetical protein